MRKTLLLSLVLAGLMLCAPAQAEPYVLDPIYASVDVPDSYIVLTSENLGEYSDWLASRDMDVEAMASDFTARGVLMQCWTAEYDACFELTAVQNEKSAAIFDVNEQSTSVRGTYRTGFYPNELYASEGYDFTASDWKNTANGRFLVLRYTKRDNGEITHRGFMRRTIRNGYEITLDMQIYGRAVTNKDNANLNRIWDTFQFIEVLPLPPAASAKINITEIPPKQTKEQTFEIRGTASEGVRFTAVTMGLSYPDPILSEAVVPKNGKFTLPIKLPKEGVFLVTLTAEYQGEDVMETAYPVTFQRTLLAVNVTTDVPDVVTQNELDILGTGEPGASIQIYVNDERAGSKKVTPAGKFKVEVDTSDEGDYRVELLFSKKDLADQRIEINFTRKWTEQDMIEQLKKQAIKPGYATLTKKIEGYTGSVMAYDAYLTSVTESGDDFILRMALKKNRNTYSNIILVTSGERPTFAVGEKVQMFGTCTGMSIGDGAEDEAEASSESYPCFDLLLLASLG